MSFNKPTYILITHSHIDHIACLPFTMIGDVNGDHVFNLFGPEEAESYIGRYIKSMFEANALEEIK